MLVGLMRGRHLILPKKSGMNKKSAKWRFFILFAFFAGTSNINQKGSYFLGDVLNG